jgi:hypothetical protein
LTHQSGIAVAAYRRVLEIDPRHLNAQSRDRDLEGGARLALRDDE